MSTPSLTIADFAPYRHEIDGCGCRRCEYIYRLATRSLGPQSWNFRNACEELLADLKAGKHTRQKLDNYLHFRLALASMNETINQS